MGETAVVNILKRASEMNISQKFNGYSKVRIYVGADDDGNPIVYSAGNDTGRILEIQNDFGTQEMANNILESIRGYQYQPLEASGALLDPSAEMGDGVSVNGVYSGIFTRATTFGRLMAADIAAPTDEEIAHEYSVETASTDRAFSRFVKSTRAAISINATEISAEVERATTAEESLSSRITINAESITSEVTRATEAESSLSTRITQNANSISAEVTRATKAEGTLSSNITATAESIKSTVAASGVWDSDGYSISVNGYGTPTANKVEASAHSNQYYLDKSSGRLWLSNGTRWSAVKYLTSIQSSLHQTADSISAQVTSQGNTKLDKTFTNSSFGWDLTSTSFSINANKSQNIFYADKNGIKIRGNAEVTGKITATSGYIGNSSNGFTIQASSIYNGKSGLTTNSNGVYIGTNGIALGSLASGKTHSKFQVDSNGNLYATNATIEGSVKVTSGSIKLGSNFSVSSTGAVTIKSGSINIGNGAFYVDTQGNLTATSGTFKGAVFAGQINYGDYSAYGGENYGYFSGFGLTNGTVTGGVTGTSWYDYQATGALDVGTVENLNTAFTQTLKQVDDNAANIATLSAGYFKSISTSSIAFSDDSGDYYFYVLDGYVRAGRIY